MKSGKWILGVLMALMAAAPAGAQSQRMAMPAYFYPGPLWTKLESAAPTCGLAVVNPNSGPGTASNPDYVKQIHEAQAHGLIVLGYVHTSYAKRSLATVEAEAKDYFTWYHVNGILFDEASSSASDIGYYRSCDQFVHAQNPKAMVVLNPGTQAAQGYMSVCNILINFESDEKAYQSYQAPAWITHYPASRFWHIILNVPTVADLQKVIRESKARHAGWVYVTPFGANNTNPYNKLPDDPYWSDELAALKH
jgi:hypothetical protein